MTSLLRFNKFPKVVKLPKFRISAVLHSSGFKLEVAETIYNIHAKDVCYRLEDDNELWPSLLFNVNMQFKSVFVSVENIAL